MIALATRARRLRLLTRTAAAATVITALAAGIAGPFATTGLPPITAIAAWVACLASLAAFAVARRAYSAALDSYAAACAGAQLPPILIELGRLRGHLNTRTVRLLEPIAWEGLLALRPAPDDPTTYLAATADHPAVVAGARMITTGLANAPARSSALLPARRAARAYRTLTHRHAAMPTAVRLSAAVAEAIFQAEPDALRFLQSTLVAFRRDLARQGVTLDRSMRLD